MESTSHFRTINENMLDLLDSCRICMGWTLAMQSLFAAENGSLVENIKYCTGLALKQEDGLPSLICQICINSLKEAYRFKMKCLESNDVFHKLQLNEIKQEVDEGPGPDEQSDDNFENDDVAKGEVKLEDCVTKHVEIDNVSDLAIPLPPLKCKGPYKKKPVKLRKEYNMVKKKAPVIIWKCDTCLLEFNSRRAYTKHRREQHDDFDVDSGVCEVCGVFFPKRAALHSHMIGHQPTIYECAKCDYKTNRKNDLPKHLRVHDDIKLYQCQFCPRTMRTSSSLHAHIRNAHEKLRPYRCTLCDKSYLDKIKLRIHIDSHSDIKRHRCEYCTSSFTRRCYWKKHLQKQHGVVLPPEKPGRRSLRLKMEDLGGLATIDHVDKFNEVTGSSQQAVGI